MYHHVKYTLIFFSFILYNHGFTWCKCGNLQFWKYPCGRARNRKHKGLNPHRNYVSENELDKVAKEVFPDSFRPLDPAEHQAALPYSWIDNGIILDGKRSSVRPNISVHLSLHVFAWRRVKSLRRLCRSLLQATYDRHQGIPLVFHIDGGYNPNVLDYIQSFYWPHGKKRVDIKKKHIGLLQNVITSWKPESDTEFALFLEDDIEVSPMYFKWSQYCINIMTSSASSNYMENGLIGCSLITPRIDEINPTVDTTNPPRWTYQPSEVHVIFHNPIMGTSSLTVFLTKFHPNLFFFQLPSSWGGIYRGDAWRKYLAYMDVRLPLSNAYPPIPNSRTNTWERSWKRYFVEFMYQQALVLLYPNFKDQASFSTNYYEQGVHSVQAGHVIYVPDVLREALDDRFTVPLIQTEEFFELLPDSKSHIFRTSLGCALEGDVVYNGDRPIGYVDLYHTVLQDGRQTLLHRATRFADGHFGNISSDVAAILSPNVPRTSN